MSKKIIRPINPKTGKVYSRSYTWRQRHPDKVEEIKRKMRSPEELFKSSVRGLKNKEYLREVKLKYYHEHKARLIMKRKLREEDNNELAQQKVNAHNHSTWHYEKKDLCELCGENKEKLETHHWNYAKPMMVNTLCRTCHKIQHIKNFERWHNCKLEADKRLEVNLSPPPM